MDLLPNSSWSGSILFRNLAGINVLNTPTKHTKKTKNYSLSQVILPTTLMKKKLITLNYKSEEVK